MNTSFVAEFPHFSIYARAFDISANVEPGQIVAYSKPSEVGKPRNVVIADGDRKFTVPMPSDLGRSLRTVIGPDAEARVAILAKCFLRARVAACDPEDYHGLFLQHAFGDYQEHRERIITDGSVEFSKAIWHNMVAYDGNSHRVGALFGAIDNDVKFASLKRDHPNYFKTSLQTA